MKISSKHLLALMLMAVAVNASAQTGEMADAFRADGKIYVVVAIILIVLAGLITYLFLLDRKLNKLEKLIEAKKQTKRAGKTF
jgi:hypothetical protein